MIKYASAAVASAIFLGGAVATSALSLTSPDIKPGAKIADEQIFNGFGCTGKNISPALSWSGAPKGTIVGQNPPGGERIQADATVELGVAD